MSGKTRVFRLLPEKLINSAVFLVSLAWMTMLHFLDYENNSKIASIYARFVVLVIVHTVPFAVSGAVFVLLRNRVKTNSLILWLVSSIVVGSALRGYTNFYLLNFISERKVEGLAFRVSASATNASFAILMAWAAYSAIDSHKRRKQSLLEEREQLIMLRQQTREQLGRFDSEAAEEIRTSLIASVDFENRNDAEQLVASMRRLMEDVVRPLSHYFERQSDDWIPPEPRKQSLALDWGLVLRTAFRASNIKVVPLLGMLIWTSFHNNLFNRGPLIALVSASHVVACFPVFEAIKRLGSRFSRNQSTGVQALVFFFGLFLGGEFLGLTAWVYTRYQEPHFFYAVIGPVFAMVGGGLIAFAHTAIVESEYMEESLRATDRDLRWSLARAREMHRQQRRALAHALHGRVQASVDSGILRLEMSNKKDRFTKELADEIIESVKSTVNSVNLLSTPNETLDVVVERIRSTWKGIATVSFSVQPWIADALRNDHTCAIALNDVLTELTYNSVKHGAASSVAITLESMDFRTIVVSVCDNGQPLSQFSRRGLGSALLDDCAISWERLRVDGQTKTIVELPVAVGIAAIPQSVDSL